MSHVQEDHDEAVLPFVGIIIAELTSATVVSQLSRTHDVSRQTLYRWTARGVRALEEALGGGWLLRSRPPRFRHWS